MGHIHILLSVTVLDVQQHKKEQTGHYDLTEHERENRVKDTNGVMAALTAKYCRPATCCLLVWNPKLKKHGTFFLRTVCAMNSKLWNSSMILSHSLSSAPLSGGVSHCGLKDMDQLAGHWWSAQEEAGGCVQGTNPGDDLLLGLQCVNHGHVGRN